MTGPRDGPRDGSPASETPVRPLCLADPNLWAQIGAQHSETTGRHP